MLPLNVFGPRTFFRVYECYPVARRRTEVERGDKIILPWSALQELTYLETTYPMLFRVTCGRSGRASHCGVLEFVAEEGRVYLPRWMMRNLAAEEGDAVAVESSGLPVATYTKLRPQSVDFLDISDHRAVLENTLRNFTCLTTGDCVAIYYNDKVYEMRVLETRPEPAVCIIECDMQVEFEAPVEYEDESRDGVHQAQGEEFQDREFVPFSGQGNVLVIKKKKISSDSMIEKSPTASTRAQRRGVPDYGFTVGVLKFFRSKPVEEDSTTEYKAPALHIPEPFSGPGHSLKPPDHQNNP